MSVFKGISSQVNERTRSPLYGSYIICWILWNWKVFVFLFFADKQEVGYSSITDYIAENYFDKWYAYLWAPLGISLVFIYLLPYFDKLIIQYSEEQKKQKNDIKLRIAKKHPVSGEMYYALKDQLEQEKLKVVHNDEALVKNTETIKLLEQNISKKDIEISEFDIEKEKMQIPLNELRALKSKGDFSILNGNHNAIWFNRKNAETIMKISFLVNNGVISATKTDSEEVVMLKIKGFSKIGDNIEFFVVKEDEVLYYFKFKDDEYGFIGTEGNYGANWIDQSKLKKNKK